MGFVCCTHYDFDRVYDLATLRYCFTVYALIVSMGAIADAKTNVLLIVADDMGYSDLGS